MSLSNFPAKVDPKPAPNPPPNEKQPLFMALRTQNSVETSAILLKKRKQGESFRMYQPEKVDNLDQKLRRLRKFSDTIFQNYITEHPTGKILKTESSNQLLWGQKRNKFYPLPHLFGPIWSNLAPRFTKRFFQSDNVYIYNFLIINKISKFREFN